MTFMSLDQTPLNQHSLLAIESWLEQLGAKKSVDNPCLWHLDKEYWSVEIFIQKDSIRVIWDQKGVRNQCDFSYGLYREDVERAILQGP